MADSSPDLVERVRDRLRERLSYQNARLHQRVSFNGRHGVLVNVAMGYVSVRWDDDNYAIATDFRWHAVSPFPDEIGVAEDLRIIRW